jgi:hypothetical protein
MNTRSRSGLCPTTPPTITSTAWAPMSRCRSCILICAEGGKKVTYWDDPLSHLRTEFGFDVLQVAQRRYAPERYHAFIGFQVAKPVLERAFLDTYGLELKDVFGNLDLALGSFRYSVGSIIPGMTRVAWQLKRDHVTKEIPGVTKKKFLYNLSRSSSEKEWGDGLPETGLRIRFVTWVLEVIPKSGPFKSLAFRSPTPEVERFLWPASTPLSTAIVRCLRM